MENTKFTQEEIKQYLENNKLVNFQYEKGWITIDIVMSLMEISRFSKEAFEIYKENHKGSK